MGAEKISKRSLYCFLSSSGLDSHTSFYVSWFVGTFRILRYCSRRVYHSKGRKQMKVGLEFSPIIVLVLFLSFLGISFFMGMLIHLSFMHEDKNNLQG